MRTMDAWTESCQNIIEELQETANEVWVRKGNLLAGGLDAMETGMESLGLYPSNLQAGIGYGVIVAAAPTAWDLDAYELYVSKEEDGYYYRLWMVYQDFEEEEEVEDGLEGLIGWGYALYREKDGSLELLEGDTWVPTERLKEQRELFYPDLLYPEVTGEESSQEDAFEEEIPQEELEEQVLEEVEEDEGLDALDAFFEEGLAEGEVADDVMTYDDWREETDDIIQDETLMLEAKGRVLLEVLEDSLEFLLKNNRQVDRLKVFADEMKSFLEGDVTVGGMEQPLPVYLFDIHSRFVHAASLFMDEQDAPEDGLLFVKLEESPQYTSLWGASDPKWKGLHIRENMRLKVVLPRMYDIGS